VGAGVGLVRFGKRVGGKVATIEQADKPTLTKASTTGTIVKNFFCENILPLVKGILSGKNHFPERTK